MAVIPFNLWNSENTSKMSPMELNNPSKELLAYMCVFFIGKRFFQYLFFLFCSLVEPSWECYDLGPIISQRELLKVTPNHLQFFKWICLYTPSWYYKRFFLSEKSLILHFPILHKPTPLYKIKSTNPLLYFTALITWSTSLIGQIAWHLWSWIS